MDPGTPFEDGEPTVQRGSSKPVGRVGLSLRFEDELGKHDVSVTTDATMGSAPQVAIRVSEKTVSRIHARVEHRGDGPWLVDLESTNGTTLDGIRVTGAQLYDGARIGLGNMQIEVHFDRVRTEVPLWPDEHFGARLVGRSVPMRELFQQLSRVATSESTVLVTGETGTGKDLVARAIHEASSRSKGPFIVVDCGAIPESLFEAELFGHSKGAFTGADRAREGSFAAADGGTLFLDEVGELPLAMQPKLLRVLETRTVRPVGETAHQPVDVRVIAATHRDLAQLVSAGAFREDLFFRLAVLPIHVPALRTRKEDVDVLVRHFLGGQLPDPQTLAHIRDRPWLGNVRELRNFVERAGTLGTTEALRTMPVLTRPTSNLPEADPNEPFKEARERWLNHLERSYLEQWLQAKHWNVSAVAEAMGLDRTYIHRLMRKHDLGR